MSVCVGRDLDIRSCIKLYVSGLYGNRVVNAAAENHRVRILHNRVLIAAVCCTATENNRVRIRHHRVLIAAATE